MQRVSTVVTQRLPCFWKPFFWLPSDLLFIDLGLRSYEPLQCWLGWVRNEVVPFLPSLSIDSKQPWKNIDATRAGCSDCLLASYLLEDMCIPFACFGGILPATRNRCGLVCLVLRSKSLCQVHGSLQFLARVLLMGMGERYSLVVSVPSTPAWDQWQVQFKVHRSFLISWDNETIVLSGS